MQPVEILPCEWFLVNGAIVVPRATLEWHVGVNTTCMRRILASQLRQTGAWLWRHMDAKATILQKKRKKRVCAGLNFWSLRRTSAIRFSETVIQMYWNSKKSDCRGPAHSFFFFFQAQNPVQTLLFFSTLPRSHNITADDDVHRARFGMRRNSKIRKWGSLRWALTLL